MTTPMEPSPQGLLYVHDIAWTEHDKPRWMVATCKRCKHVWPVHETDSLGWRPPKADCPVSPSGAEKGAR